MNPRYAIIAAVTVVGATALLGVTDRRPQAVTTAQEFNATVITSGLDTPWDMTWGSDGMIWLSERGGNISRVDPVSGKRTKAGSVGGVYQSGEGGLMGIALHPDFPRQPFVYAMYTYSASEGTRNRLVRLRWTGTEVGPQETLLDGIPGGGIHNGSRIAIGPDRMLYISTGDAGNGASAQDPSSLGGKILRLTLDGKPAPGNPFNTGVWSMGHRNGQGLVFHPTTGVLYESEHGSGDNDEINIIEKGGNYGWPDVRGACDETTERQFCARRKVVEPLTSWTPTVAISGADLYLSNRIPGFQNSLLATSLNGRTLWRMTLSADGKRVTGREAVVAGTYGRLRDVLVSPSGEIFICTSNRDGRGSPADADDRVVRLTPR